MWSYRHRGFTVHQLPALADNYVYLIDAPQANCLACVDPPEAEVVIAACKALGRKLSHILNTHHHWDHTGGNLELKQHFGCEIIASAYDHDRIPGIGTQVHGGETLMLGDLRAAVLAVPGHTLGHVAYIIADALFCGDTLFGGGCGRLFEGTPAQMWQSLSKIMRLPETTRFYCAHEYTMKNLGFALSIDPDNNALQARLKQAKMLRAQGKPTVPVSLGEERATNPFLRPLDAAWFHAYASAHGIDDDAVSVFAHLRAARDRW